MRLKPVIAGIVALRILFSASLAMAGQIRVAVASNFINPVRAIAKSFEERSDHKIIVIAGSTGKLSAQISNGAPFHIFFAADRLHPKTLEEEGEAIRGSRFTYALGRVVLWSPYPDYIDPEGKTLYRKDFAHLAIANPKLAPYGRAAREILQKRGLWERLTGRVVRAENIGQAFGFVTSGAAKLGFLALSQIKLPGRKIQGSYWEPPQKLYHPIDQQAVLIKDDPVAREFLAFVQTDQSRKIILSYGYRLP